MKLILNAINGRYLLNVTANASKNTEHVEAAVAYATEAALLFDWCSKHNIPLKFWGRLDETVPVSVPILRRFLQARSPSYSCKLLPHFHAKVIWWHGVGAYIGSANLTNAAWYNNVEAGCFFTEEEMFEEAIDEELRAFFRSIDEHASPLTEELFLQLERRAQEIKSTTLKDQNELKKLLNSPSVTKWDGLAHRTLSSATEERKTHFLEEWYKTLQELRDIGTRISDDANRPRWIPAGVPSGAQADQFLHAHYYSHVIRERRSEYESDFAKNRENPEAALSAAIKWWSELKSPPHEEARTLLEWTPFLQEMLAKDRILTLSGKEFEEVCKRVWSIQDHGRRVRNTTLGLPDGRQYAMEEKTHALAKYLYSRTSANGSSILETLFYVIHDGNDENLPVRLWNATSPHGEFRIDHLGRSAVGELVGWAKPNAFPPRNNRTSKSLRSLGFHVDIYENASSERN